MIAQVIETKTCATCPYFENFHEPNGRGWCHLFDQQAREHHALTNDCSQNAHSLETQEASGSTHPSALEPLPSAFAQEAAQVELDQYLEEQAERIAPQKCINFTLRARACRSITLINQSGWLYQKGSSTPYRQSTFEVVGSTGNLYFVNHDTRRSYPQCTCKGAQYGKCYHASAVLAKAKSKRNHSSTSASCLLPSAFPNNNG